LQKYAGAPERKKNRQTHNFFSLFTTIARWRFSVSSICVIWVFPLHFTSVKFLRNGVLILNWKENKEAGAICFEIRIPRKKNKELLWKVPSKIYESYFIMETTKSFFGLSIIPNIITEKWGACHMTFRAVPYWHLYGSKQSNGLALNLYVFARNTLALHCSPISRWWYSELLTNQKMFLFFSIIK
jgi:hypothetical protein